MSAPQDSSHAVGNVYAQALLEAANERGQTDELAAEFADLVALMDRDADFAGFMTTLMLSHEKRRASLDTLFRGKMNDLLLNTLQVLNRRGRPELVRAVYDRFCDQLRKQRNQVEVTVRTAVPLSDEMRETLQKFMSEQIGSEAILTTRMDPALLGGLVVQVGDHRVDTTIATRLRKLHQRLLDRASTEIHQGRKYFAEA